MYRLVVSGKGRAKSLDAAFPTMQLFFFQLLSLVFFYFCPSDNSWEGSFVNDSDELACFTRSEVTALPESRDSGRQGGETGGLINLHFNKHDTHESVCRMFILPPSWVMKQ